MKGASILKKFIAGMIFATAIAPILDSATAVIMTGLEAIKGKWTVKITEYNYQIQKLGDESTPVRAIGFAAPVEEDDYEED
jgi:hypothetical protein